MEAIGGRDLPPPMRDVAWTLGPRRWTFVPLLALSAENPPVGKCWRRGQATAAAWAFVECAKRLHCIQLRGRRLARMSRLRARTALPPRHCAPTRRRGLRSAGGLPRPQSFPNVFSSALFFSLRGTYHCKWELARNLSRTVLQISDENVGAVGATACVRNLVHTGCS
jgi:hypothetical protein